MEMIAFRTGLFLGLYAKLFPQKAIGIIITASHNPIQDNGLKISEWNGQHLNSQYEKIICRFLATKDLVVGFQKMRGEVQTLNKLEEDMTML